MNKLFLNPTLTFFFSLALSLLHCLEAKEFYALYYYATNSSSEYSSHEFGNFTKKGEGKILVREDCTISQIQKALKLDSSFLGLYTIL